jgi:hypothetical protein
MWKRAVIFALIAVLGGLITVGTLGNSIQRSGNATREQNQWIANALQEIQSVQVNMKRSDLHRVFTTEGGISTRLSRVYIYKKSPFIKVSVQFQAAKGNDNPSTESDDDKIIGISKPYLEYPISD